MTINDEIAVVEKYSKNDHHAVSAESRLPECHLFCVHNPLALQLAKIVICHQNLDPEKCYFLFGAEYEFNAEVDSFKFDDLRAPVKFHRMHLYTARGYIENSFATGDHGVQFDILEKLYAEVRSVTHGRAFSVYMPNHLSFYFNMLLSNPDCVQFNYIDDGLLSIGSAPLNKIGAKWEKMLHKDMLARILYEYKKPVKHFKYAHAFACTNKTFEGCPNRIELNVLDSFPIYRDPSFENADAILILGNELRNAKGSLSESIYNVIIKNLVENVFEKRGYKKVLVRYKNFRNGGYIDKLKNYFMNHKKIEFQEIEAPIFMESLLKSYELPVYCTVTTLGYFAAEMGREVYEFFCSYPKESRSLMTGYTNTAYKKLLSHPGLRSLSVPINAVDRIKIQWHLRPLYDAMFKRGVKRTIKAIPKVPSVIYRGMKKVYTFLKRSSRNVAKYLYHKARSLKESVRNVYDSFQEKRNIRAYFQLLEKIGNTNAELHQKETFCPSQMGSMASTIFVSRPEKNWNYTLGPCRPLIEKANVIYFKRDCDRWKNADLFVILGIGQKSAVLYMSFLKHCLKARARALFLESGFISYVHSSGDQSKSVKAYKNRICNIVDDIGFYYIAHMPTRMEILLNSQEITTDQINRSRKLIDRIVSNRLTKYNHQPIFTPSYGTPGRKKVLVVDQTFGDCSITLGGASEETFSEMLEDAIRDNPDADILVKTHPDLFHANKKKRTGFYTDVKRQGNVIPIREMINPISLLKAVDKVYVVTSQLGFEALMCGKETHIYGMPFYAGWGVTHDKQKNARRTRTRSIEEIFYIAYIMLSVYYNPETNETCEIEEAIDYLIEKRESYFRQFGVRCDLTELPTELQVVGRTFEGTPEDISESQSEISSRRAS